MSPVLRILPTRMIAMLLVAAASGLALGACGDSSETPTSPSSSPAAAPPADPAPSDGSSASSGTSNAQDAARVKLTQCLRKEGIELPDAQGHGAFAQLSPADRQRLEAALQGPCQRYSSQAFGDTSQPQSQDFLDDLTSFTVCLRKQGVDVPDPDPNNPFAVLHGLDQSDPKMAAAVDACRDKLAALNGGG